MPRYNPSSSLMYGNTMAQRRYNMWLRAQQQAWMLQQRQGFAQQQAEAAAGYRNRQAQLNSDLAEGRRLERFTPWAHSADEGQVLGQPAPPQNRYIPGPDPVLRPQYRQRNATGSPTGDPQLDLVSAVTGKQFLTNAGTRPYNPALYAKYLGDNHFGPTQYQAPNDQTQTQLANAGSMPAQMDWSETSPENPDNNSDFSLYPGEEADSVVQNAPGANDVATDGSDASDDGMGEFNVQDSGAPAANPAASDADVEGTGAGDLGGGMVTGNFNNGQIGAGLYAPADPQSISATGAAINANQNAIAAPAQAANKQLWAAIARGNPDAVDMGLQQGLLYHSPQQKAQIAELQHTLQRIDNDPSLTYAERAHARVQALRQLHSIRPMVTPVDQQPVDPVTRFQSEVTTVPDSVTGKPMRVTHDRSGRPVEFITEREKQQIKSEGVAEEERIKFNAQHGLDRDGKPLVDANQNPIQPKLLPKPKTYRQNVYNSDGKEYRALRKDAIKEIQQMHSPSDDGRPYQPSPDEVQKKMEEMISAHEKFSQGGQPPTVSQIYGKPSQQQTPSQQTPAQQSQMERDERTSLPMPKSEAEAMSLPPKTPFMGTDGKVHIRP